MSILQGLIRVNRDLVASIQKHRPKTEATLDMDATLVETQKEDALFSYKGYKAYQPFNVWWAEQELVLHTEFRDGNVPAGYEQLRVFKEALDMLPEGVNNGVPPFRYGRLSARSSQVLRERREQTFRQDRVRHRR